MNLHDRLEVPPNRASLLLLQISSLLICLSLGILGCDGPSRPTATVIPEPGTSPSGGLSESEAAEVADPTTNQTPAF